MTYAVEYAVKITELKTETCDASGRVISMRKCVEPPSGKPEEPA
jgi:hypothetical protein